ncbi:MAG: UDP-N-acetylmuramoyl-tripeptide--D-alanyl-D-alanine ligase [bacterium]
MERWSGAKWAQARPDAVNGVSINTRALVRGSIYVALKGMTFDGHDFVEQAFDGGAVAALVRQDYPARSLGAGRCLLRARDTLAALQNLAGGYRRHMGIEVVGVTGSAGKTTVKEMTADVLSAIAPVTRTIGNLNNDIGVPLSLLAMEHTTRIGVFEVGTNHPGELAPLCAMIAPQWGIVTNIGPVHLEFLVSVDGVAAEKGELLKVLPADGTAILCRDDAFYSRLKSLVCGRVLDISMRGDADFSFAGMTANGEEAIVREKASGETFRFRPPVPGDHNICNAMFAIAAGRGHGMQWYDIRNAIEHYTPLPMRWQQENVRGVTIINDAYNANPMSMEAAIEAFYRIRSSGRKWLVMGGMAELGVSSRKFHMELGRRIAGGDWAGLLVIGDSGAWIADGARTAGFDEKRISICKDNGEAARVLHNKVRETDLVLLKASRSMKIEEVRNQYVLLAV